MEGSVVECSAVGNGLSVGRRSGEGRGGGIRKRRGSRYSAGAWDVGVRQCLRSRVWGSVGATGTVTGIVAGAGVRESVEVG